MDKQVYAPDQIKTIPNPLAECLKLRNHPYLDIDFDMYRPDDPAFSAVTDALCKALDDYIVTLRRAIEAYNAATLAPIAAVRVRIVRAPGEQPPGRFRP